ncbi:hypothetical protein OROMI_014263 [Orobanche minor]
MALNINFVLPKIDLHLMLKKEKQPINGIKNASIYCRARAIDLPTKVKTKSLYQVLSLESQNVGFDELKKAYRAKARQLHPHVVPSSVKEECTKKFVELREAYEVLSDPNSRRLYDLSLVESGCNSRRVWETQLEGLKHRSVKRSERRKNVRLV